VGGVCSPARPLQTLWSAKRSGLGARILKRVQSAKKLQGIAFNPRLGSWGRAPAATVEKELRYDLDWEVRLLAPS
jgi:hypothetical protein